MKKTWRGHLPPRLWMGLLLATAAACADTAPRAEPAPPTLAAPLLIGAVDGDGPDVFGSIGALTADAASRILVFDGRARELRVFGADGSFVSSFGRRGGGPGEFQHVIGLSVAPDGAVWVVDGATARYTVLRDGEVATYPRGAGVYTVPWLGGHAGGDLYDAVVVPGGESRDALVRVDAGGTVVDTFPVPPSDIETPRRGTIDLPLPYAPRQLRAFDPRGAVWVASSHEYALHRIAPAGDTVAVLRRDLSPRPLTAAEADSVGRYIRTLRDEFRVDVRDALVPRTAPLLTRLTVADDGSLWVTRADPPAGAAAGTVLDLFDADGRFAGTVEVGVPLSLRAVRGGHVYGVVRDELGVERVYRARIERGD